MSPGIQKLIGSLNDSSCTYLMRQNLCDKYCVRSQEINVLAVLDDDLRKIAEVSALIVIVNAWNWKMRKNFTPNPSLKKIIIVMIKLGIIVSWLFMPILCNVHRTNGKAISMKGAVPLTAHLLEKLNHNFSMYLWDIAQSYNFYVCTWFGLSI